MAAQGEGRGGVPLLNSFLDVLELARRVPELEPRVAPVARSIIDFCRQAAQMVALAAEGSEFDETLKLDGVAGLAANLSEELTKIIELIQTAGLVVPEQAATVRAELVGVRDRIGEALRRRAARTFEQARAATKSGDPLEALTADSRRLRDLEQALAELSPKHLGLRSQLLTPLGELYARDTMASASFTRIEQLARVLQPVVDNLTREGAAVPPAMRAVREVLEKRLLEYVQAMQPPRSPSPDAVQIFSGEAYNAYRRSLSANTPDGEAQALQSLSELFELHGSSPLPRGMLEQVETAEIASLISRVRYLRTWLSQLLGSLPTPEDVRARAEADRAFDLLVKSRFPTLVTREGELVRLESSLRRLRGAGAERGEAVTKLVATLKTITEDFMGFAKRLLDVRAAK